MYLDVSSEANGHPALKSRSRCCRLRRTESCVSGLLTAALLVACWLLSKYQEASKSRVRLVQVQVMKSPGCRNMP